MKAHNVMDAAFWPVFLDFGSYTKNIYEYSFFWFEAAIHDDLFCDWFDFPEKKMNVCSM